MNEKLINRIKTNKLFENIDISLLNSEEIKGKLFTYQSGGLVFSEGDPSEYVYLVVSGQINVMKKAVLSGPKHQTFVAGDFFGVEELAEGTNRICTAVATEDSYCVGLTLKELQYLIDKDVTIQENIFKYSEITKPEEEAQNTTEEVVQQEIEQPQTEETQNWEELKNEPPVDSIDLTAEIINESMSDTPPAEIPAEPVPDITPEVPPAAPEDIDTPPIAEDDFMDPLAALDAMIDTPPIGDQISENNVVPLEEIQETTVEQSEEEPPVQQNIENDLPFDMPPIDNVESIEQTEQSQAIPDMNDLTPPDIVDVPPVDTPIPEQIDTVIPEDIPNVPEVPEYDQSTTTPPEVSVTESMIEEHPAVTETETSEYWDPKLTMAFYSEMLRAVKESELRSSFVKYVREFLNVEHAALYSIKDKVLETSIEVDGKEKQIFQKIGEGVTGLSAEIGEKIVVQDAKRESRIYEDPISRVISNINNLMTVPFTKGNDNFMMLLINKESNFDSDDEEKARELFEVYYAGMTRLNSFNESLKKDQKRFSGLLVNFLNANFKSKAQLIKNYVEHMLKHQLPEEDKSLANLIKDASGEALEKLKFAAIVDGSEIRLHPVEISLNKILDAFFNKYEDYFADKYCTILKKYDDDVLVSIDKEYFERVLIEICSNSIDAMPFGGNIGVRTKKKENSVEIILSDNGKGLEGTDIDLIFEPFVTTKADRSGFGLAFVRNVIKAMRGDIRARKKDDKGLAIHITLPVINI